MGWSPWQMEWRIRQGDFNRYLLRPIHPIHDDTAQMVSWKFLELMNVIPTMIILTLLFKPEIELKGWAIAAFFPALLLAFASRYIFLWAIALVAFWTTRVNALFNLMFAVEFLISGRIAPISVLPAWGQQIAHIMPFYWMFGFPLDLLIGRLTPEETLIGIGIQTAWVTVMTILLMVIWRVAVKRYSAVGG
jgi:ABC-2 type transport system permease protein